MQLYKLTLTTIFQRKVWVVTLMWLLVLPTVLPNIMSYNNPTLIEPARAQAAWVSLWLIGMIWVVFQAARFGEDNAKSGLGAYFLGLGKSHINQLGQIWLACLTVLVPFVLITIAICLIGARPSDPAQAEVWSILNLQSGIVFIFALAPLLLLASALGSRLGSTAGFVVPVFLLLYGLYGVGTIGMMSDKTNSPMLDWLVVFSPHYHLADFTERLVFRLGEMVWSEYFQVLAYFSGLGLVLAVFSMLYFRAKSNA